MVKEKCFNPVDLFRKEQKKKEQKKAKETRDAAREVRNLLNDPTKIDREIQKVQLQSNENRLDKGLKDRIVELKRMKDIAIQKKKIDIANGRRVNVASAPSVPSSSISQNLHPPPPPPQTYPNYSAQYSAHQQYQYSSSVLNQQMFTQYPHQAGFVGVGNPVLMGGMNGIPLPPPRSSSSLYGNLPPPPLPPRTHNHQSNRQNQRKRDHRNDGYIDPLDPTASGYTERFGRKNDISHNEFIEGNNKDNIIDSSILSVQNSIATDNENATAEDNDKEEDAEIRHRLAMIAASYRKEGTCSNTEIVSHSPSLAERNKRGRESTREDGTSEVLPKRSKASKPEESSSFVLPGMEFYGDEEEGEEEENESDNEDTDSDGGEANNDEYAVRPSLPNGGISCDMYNVNHFPALMDPEEYLQHLQQQQSNLEQYYSDKNDNMRNEQVWVEDADDDESETNTVKKATIKASAPAASVKVDAALTAFKPSSVGRSSAGKKQAFAPKPPSSVPPTAATSLTSSSVKKVVEAKPSASKALEAASDIDDDYGRFMAEISEL